MGGCKKKGVTPVNIYEPGPAVLVKFLRGGPSPEVASDGSIVTYNVSGLKGKNPADFTFFINQVAAEVIEIAENTIKVKVPPGARTGNCSILINGEYYFGPNITIRGLVSIDDQFDPGKTFSAGNIRGIIPIGTNLLVYGSFNNFNNLSTEDAPIRGTTIINENGTYISRFFDSKKGISGYVNDVIQVGNKYLFGGGFSGINYTRFLSNVARISVNNNFGTVDTTLVDVIIDPDNPTEGPIDDGTTFVPDLNAGVLGQGVVKIFYDPNKERISLIGNFNSYINAIYDKSTKDVLYYNTIATNQIVGIFSDGSFDSTYNYNFATKKGYDGGNGSIYDAVKLDDERIVAVGSFTNYNGQRYNRIVCIDPETGLPDVSFSSNTTGADADIAEINYNPITKKILICGQFTKFNNNPVNGVVMLNPDGTVDESFNFKPIDVGYVNYAAQISDGRIIVSGYFNKYDGNVRQGMVILNPDGSLATNCNNFGSFVGAIEDIYEFPSLGGSVQLMLVGSISKFDGITVGNIVKIRIKNQ